VGVAVAGELAVEMLVARRAMESREVKGTKRLALAIAVVRTE